MIFLTTLLASVLITALAVPLLSRLAFRCRLVDVPDERKVHSHPIPRVGGLAMALGTLMPIWYWVGREPFAFAYVAGVSVLIPFGLLDDLFDLRPVWKLVGQIAAASITVFLGGVKITSLGTILPDGLLLQDPVAFPLTIFVIVGVTNAINLADGLDGLAGGISLLSLCCISYLAFLQADITIGIIALALAGATFGFLRYNTYPANIFMGDVGSQFLGFSNIVLALSLTQGATALSPLLPLLLLGFPVLDTLTVMAGRIARGISPFTADKTHFHHVLLSLGFKQSESVMIIYLIQVSLITLGFFLRFHPDTLLLAGYLLFSLSALLFFSRARKKRWQLKRKGPLAAIQAFFRRLRGTTLISYLFQALQAGLIAVLLLSALSMAGLPCQAAVAAGIAMPLIILLVRFRPFLVSDALKIVLYLAIPLVIYHHEAVSRLGGVVVQFPLSIYHTLFWVLALLNILVSRVTRRDHGFQSTPLDFLVLFIVLIAPQLQDSNLPGYTLLLMAAKIVICYFSCEIVLAESRGHIRLMTRATLALLLIVVAQGASL